MGNDSVVYIRTDGNSNIATGHLVRCLCIAQALENLGKSVCFLVSDTTSANLLQHLAKSFFENYSFSFVVKILETAAYDNLELELEEICEFLKNNDLHNLDIQNSDNQITNIHDAILHAVKKPVVLIDSYYVTPNYFESLRKAAIIAYMDDLRAFNYHVDFVINYDVIPDSKKLEYQQAYTNAASTLLGAQYTPLRRQFQNQTVSIRENIQNILITTGGSDPFHFTKTLLLYLLSQHLLIDFHVVVGKLFDNTEFLENLAKENSSVHLHCNVSDMASLMKQCDYAVSAAGTTLYELCALGIPAISFTMADNQIIMAETFAETGAIPYAGDIRFHENPEHNSNAVSRKEATGHVCNNIKKHLHSLLLTPQQRTSQHQTMRCQVDGNGAIKIAEALCKL